MYAGSLFVENSVSNFLEHVERTCKERGVRLRLAKTCHVKISQSEFSNGYFSAQPSELAVAVKKPLSQWLPILVHESCHLDQWVDKSPFWIGGVGALSELVGSLNDENPINRSYAPIWAKLARELELDCEKRVIKKIEEWKLPINPAGYMRRANAYIWFYTMIPELLSWYKPGKEPYRDARILELCPDHFVKNYDCVPNALHKEYCRLMQK